MDLNKKKSKIGMKTSMKFLEDRGYKCTDVSEIKGNHRGYDFIAKKDGKEIKIEVKASADEHKIPDCHATEFDEDKKIIADFLYIVRLAKDLRPKKIEVLSKEEVDRYSDTYKKVERIRTTGLDTALKNGKAGKSYIVNSFP